MFGITSSNYARCFTQSSTLSVSPCAGRRSCEQHQQESTPELLFVYSRVLCLKIRTKKNPENTELFGCCIRSGLAQEPLEFVTATQNRAARVSVGPRVGKRLLRRLNSQLNPGNTASEMSAGLLCVCPALGTGTAEP